MASQKALGFTFTETMGGHVAPGGQDYREAEALGRRVGETLRFVLTVTTDDLEAFIKNPAHEATLTGTVEAQRFGGVRPIDPGTFNLFIEDENGRKQMRYRFTFQDASGQQYLFEGFKDVHNDFVVDFWKDTTTLFTTVRRADGGGEPVVTGVLYIRPRDLVPQVLSMRGVNAGSPLGHAKALSRFGMFFTERVMNEYLPLPFLRKRGREGTATPK